ncbi:MAG: DUF502 domain-containing protein [Methanocellales archaeon]|nr:DUF502 domain-containing protein [Methanocellales archaeon]
MMSSRLRKYFVTGLVVLIPLVATSYILWILFDLLDGILRPLVTEIFGVYIPGLSLVIMLLLTLLVGFIANYTIGKKGVKLFEESLCRIPMVRTIYLAIKQASDILFMQKEEFQKVVLVEYPRRGIYVLGFVTGSGVEEIQEKTSEDVLNLFVPTAPNPTSGFLLMVPKKDVIVLDMSVEDGLKMIISGGLLAPTNEGR